MPGAPAYEMALNIHGNNHECNVRIITLNSDGHMTLRCTLTSANESNSE